MKTLFIPFSQQSYSNIVLSLDTNVAIIFLLFIYDSSQNLPEPRLKHQLQHREEWVREVHNLQKWYSNQSSSQKWEVHQQTHLIEGRVAQVVEDAFQPFHVLGREQDETNIFLFSVVQIYQGVL